jgi:hypothetical protein
MVLQVRIRWALPGAFVPSNALGVV